MSAVFSPDRVYRYTLEREWLPRDEELGALFVLLNPSTADETTDDPTVRRCMGFAATWGYSHLTVCNLFALRSTDPQALYSHEDPVGPDNDEWIRRNASRAELIVAAWGVHGELRSRGDLVLTELERHDVVHCLGLTKDGHPRHPLYLAATTRPVPIREAVAA